jgi:hypothetical protein
MMNYFSSYVLSNFTVFWQESTNFRGCFILIYASRHAIRASEYQSLQKENGTQWLESIPGTFACQRERMKRKSDFASLCPII